MFAINEKRLPLNNQNKSVNEPGLLDVAVVERQQAPPSIDNRRTLTHTHAHTLDNPHRVAAAFYNHSRPHGDRSQLCGLHTGGACAHTHTVKQGEIHPAVALMYGRWAGQNTIWPISSIQSAKRKRRDCSCGRGLLMTHCALISMEKLVHSVFLHRSIRTPSPAGAVSVSKCF